MSAKLSLPENCHAAVMRLLHDALPDADAAAERRCLEEVTPLYDAPGMSESAFLLRARGAVYAFAQRRIASSAQVDPATLRAHIRMTLRRCLPIAITDDMVERCLKQLTPDASDPMHTGAIHQFAAAELLSEPTEDDPLRRRLHESALKHLPVSRPVDRDDLRLVALDALFDPSWLPCSSHAGFLRLRLGLKGARQHSCEEIAARMHLPLNAIHAMEANELFTLTRHYQRRRIPDVT